MIELKEITIENFWDIMDLHVKPEQTDLVVSNAVSVAQSKIQPECVPLAAYKGDTPVGFVMYCIDRDDKEYWVYRLMIDERFQRKGYGREVMDLVISKIREDLSRHRIYLGVDPHGKESVKLYESLGFVFTGQVFGKEHIMVLDY
jgi:diamine N-acetyltransferase